MLTTWPEHYVVLTLFAAALFAVGNALQKHVIAGRLSSVPAGPFLSRFRHVVFVLARSPAWMLGLPITIAAFLLEMQALALGDVTVVKPLSRLQILFVLAIGVIVLGERLARAEWIGVSIVIIGALFLAGMPANASATAPNAVEVAAAATAIGTITIAGLWLSNLGRNRPPQHLSALAAGSFFGLGDILMKASTGIVLSRDGDFDVVGGDTVSSLTAEPLFVMSLLATASAFVTQQIAFSQGRVSLTVPLIGVGATAVVAALGFTLLQEQITAARIAGIAWVLAGAAIIGMASTGDVRGAASRRN